MRIKDATRIIINKIVRVENKSVIASFFFPSRNHIIGLPNTKKPVRAAENTKSINIVIGINKVSFSPGKIFSKEDIKITITPIYRAVPRALIRAYFIVFPIRIRIFVSLIRLCWNTTFCYKIKRPHRRRGSLGTLMGCI